MIEQIFSLMKALEAGTYTNMEYPEAIFSFFKENPSTKCYERLRIQSSDEPLKFVLNPLCKENNFPEMSDQEMLDFIAVSLKLNS